MLELQQCAKAPSRKFSFPTQRSTCSSKKPFVAAACRALAAAVASWLCFSCAASASRCAAALASRCFSAFAWAAA